MIALQLVCAGCARRRPELMFDGEVTRADIEDERDSAREDGWRRSRMSQKADTHDYCPLCVNHITIQRERRKKDRNQ